MADQTEVLETDVAIIGGGPVGLFLAAELAYRYIIAHSFAKKARLYYHN